jgi:hypothetical protein
MMSQDDFDKAVADAATPFPPKERDERSAQLLDEQGRTLANRAWAITFEGNPIPSIIDVRRMVIELVAPSAERANEMFDEALQGRLGRDKTYLKSEFIQRISNAGIVSFVSLESVLEKLR